MLLDFFKMSFKSNVYFKENAVESPVRATPACDHPGRKESWQESGLGAGSEMNLAKGSFCFRIGISWEGR